MLLEIVGFWTREYIDSKLASLRRANLRNLVLCIDADRGCSEGDLPLKRRIGPRAVLANLGNCLDPSAGLAALGDKSVDVVITDPSYEAEAHITQRMVARAGGRLECEPIALPPITEEQRSESAPKWPASYAAGS